jgi:hypothetical protein
MFAYPEDTRWNEEEEAVQFTLCLGEYEGSVFVPRRVIEGLAGARLGPEGCLQQVHLHRAVFERAAEARIRARALDADANVWLTGRDLRRS